jgi:hypothetical protein
MFWRRARKITDQTRIDFLGRMYGQPEVTRNFGIWTEAPKRTAKPLLTAAPHILYEKERRNTVLWPALFNAWPNWHWGMQPTGDCTRWMEQHLLDVLLANLWAAGKTRKPDALVAGESIYGFAKCELANSYGYHGAGASGYDVAEACVKFGSLFRLDYRQSGKECDLREETEYSVAWGDLGHGVPDWLEPFAAEHKAKDRVAVSSPTEMGLLIQSGYPCQYCGYTSWGTVRGADGIATRFSSGWHAITATGVRWNENGEPLAFWIANTGHGDHCEGSIGPIAVPDVYAECGSWVPAAKIAPVLAAGDCYTTTFVEGWPILKLPDYATKEFLG